MYHYLISNRTTSSMKNLEFVRFVKTSDKHLKSSVLQKFKNKFSSLKNKAKEITQISKLDFDKMSKNKRVTVFK